MPTKTDSLDRVDPSWAWEAWQPDAKTPFDRKWAGHLYRRAAFGPTYTEVEQAVERGLPATLELLLNGAPQASDLEDITRPGRLISLRNNMFELRAWWLYWMIHSGHPLREKMTLFWHNHFATSVYKVQRPTLMFEQNVLLRQYALGKFGPFLLDMSKNTAMLIWLDSNSNLKAKPNENYAREVMELFSLGVGNYTENDIRAAARAFTGWHSDGDKFEFNPKEHDDGPKTLFGQTGNWNGDDVVRILLQQPACARFLVRKLFRTFISEVAEPSNRLIDPLADKLRSSDYDIGAVVRIMLSSRLFFSNHAFRQIVKSPVDYVLGSVRSVMQGQIPQRQLVAKTDLLGQNLFAPPNVKGWPGAQAWINTSTLLARQNYNQSLVMGLLWNERVANGNSPFEEIVLAEQERAEAALEAQEAGGAPGVKPATPKPKPSRPEEAAPPEDRDVATQIRKAKLTKPDEIVQRLLEIYLPGGISPTARTRLVAFVAEGAPTGTILDRRIRETVHAILCSPEYQLS